MNINKLAAATAVLAVAAGAFFVGQVEGTTDVTLAKPALIAAGDVVVGNLDAAKFWAHQTDQDCVEQSARVMIGVLTGKAPTAMAIDTFAQQAGVYTPKEGSDGTMAAAIYAHYGVTANVFYQSTLAQVEGTLAAGGHVVAYVNGPTLWQSVGFTTAKGTTFTDLDHALVIDQIDETTGIMTLTDTGVPNGATEQVTIATFEKAWVGSAGVVIQK